MKLIVLREPLTVEENGKRARAWNGKDEDGNIVRVTMSEGPSSDTLLIQVDVIDLGKIGGGS